MKKVVYKLDLPDNKAKQKAMKAVSALAGIDSISIDMKSNTLTIIGVVDPVYVVGKLRKSWLTYITTVGPVKEPEKKREEAKKEEPKKEEGKKEEPKKEEAKKEEPKKEEPKKEEPKNEEPKNEGFWVAMRDLFAPLSSVEIYQGCRTPSDGSEFSESSSEPSLSASSSAREIYEGLRTPDWLPLSQRRVDTEGVPDVESESSPTHDYVHSVAQNFTFRELVAATNNFADDCLLRQGEFGRVYKGRLESTNQVVAIRQFNVNEVNEEFLVEVQLRSRFHHPHIVEFTGYCADGNQRFVVQEYMPLGSLEDHLHDLPSGKNHLDWNTRIKIAVGVAKGLEFLHHKAYPPVIFRTLKSSNILLGEDYHPKLSDFGFEKVGSTVSVSRRVLGTQSYWAADFASLGLLSFKPAIYNFGVVLLEIITGRKAFDNCEDAVAPSLVAWARPLFKDQRRLEQMADPTLQGQYPKMGFHQALAVAAACLEDLASARPAIDDVVTALTCIALQP